MLYTTASITNCCVKTSVSIQEYFRTFRTTWACFSCCSPKHLSLPLTMDICNYLECLSSHALILYAAIKHTHTHTQLIWKPVWITVPTVSRHSILPTVLRDSKLAVLPFHFFFILVCVCVCVFPVRNKLDKTNKQKCQGLMECHGKHCYEHPVQLSGQRSVTDVNYISKEQGSDSNTQWYIIDCLDLWGARYTK